MADTVLNVPSRGRNSKRVIIALVGLLILLGVLYFTATSSWFVKSIVLPRVSEAVHATVTAEDVSLNPFSSATVRGLRVTTQGESPLALIREIRVRYSLLDILRGTITVDELTVNGAELSVVPLGSGRDSLSPILEASAPSTAPAPATSSPRFQVKNLSVAGLRLRHVSLDDQGGTRVLELTNASATLDQFAQGQSGKLVLAGDATWEQVGKGLIRSRLDADWGLTLGQGPVPESVVGKSRMAVSAASGVYTNAQGLSMAVDGTWTANELRPFILRFDRDGRALTTLTTTGPLNLAKREAKLKLSIDSISRELLSLLTAGTGVDLNDTAMSGEANVELKQGGSLVSMTGALSVKPFSVTREGMRTPNTDLSLALGMSANLDAKTAVLHGFELKGNQSGKTWLNGMLTAPLSVAWGGASVSSGAAALEIQVEGFNLAEWKALAGSLATEGRVQSRFKVQSSANGKDLTFEKQVDARDLVTRASTAPMRLQSSMKGRISDLSRVSVEGWDASMSRGDNVVAQWNATASAEKTNGAFAFKTAVRILPSAFRETAGRDPFAVDCAGEGFWTSRSVLDLKKFELSFTNTAHATPNRISAQGVLNCAQTTALEGMLQVQSAGLDVTPLYEAWGNSKAAASETQTNGPASFPKEEPAPVQFPVKSFTMDVTLASLFLGEIKADQVQSKIVVQGGRIQVPTLKANVGGAPVGLTADVDLSGAGMKYALAWDVGRMSLEPWVNTLNPASKGQVSGAFSSQASVKGVGITGTALKASLAGEVSMSLTNAAIQIPAGTSKVWILPIDLNRIASTLGMGDLTQSPITQVNLKAVAAKGRVDIERAEVRSDAMMATANGRLELDDSLDKSAIDIPVELYLSPTLYRKLRPLASTTDEPYSKLPSFIRLGGTVAKVDTRLDRLKMAELTAGAMLGAAGNTATNIVGKSVNAVGKAVGSIGKLFGSGKGDTNSPPETNAPSKLNPLNLFKKKP